MIEVMSHRQHKEVFPQRIEETVKPYINKAILTLTPHQTLHDACKLMIQNRIGCVVITINNQPTAVWLVSRLALSLKALLSGRSLYRGNF